MNDLATTRVKWLDRGLVVKYRTTNIPALLIVKICQKGERW